MAPGIFLDSQRSYPPWDLPFRSSCLSASRQCWVPLGAPSRLSPSGFPSVPDCMSAYLLLREWCWLCLGILGLIWLVLVPLIDRVSHGIQHVVGPAGSGVSWRWVPPCWLFWCLPPLHYNGSWVSPFLFYIATFFISCGPLLV